MLDASRGPRRSPGLLGSRSPILSSSAPTPWRALAAATRMRPRTALVALLCTLLLLVLASDRRRSALVESVEAHTTHRKRHSRAAPAVSAPFFERDGLLYTKPVPSDQLTLHPIHHLVAKAKADWHAKLRRQSKTLDQARREYRRRYGRDPPAGFAEWFAWAQRNKVILVDEYDQIERDLLPLRGTSVGARRDADIKGLPKSVLRERAEQLVTDTTNYYHTGSFTLHIREGALANITGPHADNSRASARTGDPQLARLMRQRLGCSSRSCNGCRTCA